MKAWVSLVLASLLAPLAARAQDLNIVEVRRNITLADEDPVYKDFYINGGEAEGLKKNLVVTAVRKIQIRDASGSQSYGEIQVPVGQLRVIATYGKIAVAREYKLLSRDELPMLEQTGLMSGDKIDLKASFIDNNKPVYKKKTVAVVTNKIRVPASAAIPPPTPKLEKTAETPVTKTR
ncbi:MAG: hypothetical protein ACXVB1_04925 [Pseudobdellovibrionaceae bacterium]